MPEPRSYRSPESSDSSEPSKPTTYKWTNHKQFENSNLKSEAEKVLLFTDEQSEEAHVAELFHKSMKSSKVTLLHINDKTKQMSLYNIPESIAVAQLDNKHISYLMNYDDIRSRFNYIGVLGYLFGGRGTNLYLSAFQNRSAWNYAFNFSKTLGERLDNNYRSNVDEVGFYLLNKDLKYADSLQFTLSRQSRHNHVDFYNKKAKETHKFGLQYPGTELLKHSNLLAFKYIYKYAPFIISGKIGLDFANKSMFKSLTLSASKAYPLGGSVVLNLYGTVANMWGKNILKNDLLFRNLQSWTGDRTQNYVSPRAEVSFIKYPYISSFSFSPFLYTQLWASLRKDSEQKYATKFQAEYGIGIASADARLQIDIALLRCSAERKSGVLGALRFSF